VTIVASDTWTTVAVPLLEHFAAYEVEYAERMTAIPLGEVLIATGLDSRAAALELERLFDAGYLQGNFSREYPAEQSWMIAPTLSELGARSVGRWPSRDAAEAMLAIIERRLNAAQTPEERSFWQKIRDGFAGVPGNIVGGLAVEVAKVVGGLT
jgi:hypothetical protein